MESVNWEGIATLIGAIGGFLTVCVSLVLQVLNYRDHKRQQCQLNEIHNTVNEIKAQP